MKGIEPVKVLTIFILFTLVSLASKFILFATAGTVLVNVFPNSAMAAVYLTITLSIVVSGLVIGKVINLSVHANPISHGLIVAALAGTYKAVSPEFHPLPYLFVGIFSVLNFTSILWGTHVTAEKA